jgi:hypothetical protein
MEQWHWRPLQSWLLCLQPLLRSTPATLLLATYLLLLPPVAAASLSSEQYWQLVSESQEIVARLEQLPPAAQRQALESLAARWEQVNEVRLADGSLAPLDTTLLTGLMRADPADLARLQGLLGALASAGASWPPSGHGAADAASLHAILARPEFQWQPEPATLWQRLRERLQRTLFELLDRLFPAGVALPEVGLTNVLTLIGAIALLLVIVYVARSLLGNLVTEAGLKAGEFDAEEPLTAELASQQARTLSAGGDYRSAVRYLYLSAILLLEEQGVLRYDRSLTNREYLRRVADQPAVAAHLTEVINLFDRVWYGFQPVDETSYARYRDQIAALQRIAKAGRQGATRTHGYAQRS